MALPSYSRLKVVEARINQSDKTQRIIIALAVTFLLAAVILIITLALSLKEKQLHQSAKQKSPKKLTRLLICGGHLHSRPNTNFNTCEYYFPDNPSSNRLVNSTMSTTRYWHQSQIIDGKVYIAGGSSSHSTYRTSEVFDPETEIWSQGPQLSIPRTHFVSAVINNQMWVCTGYSPKLKEIVTSCEVLDLWRNRWIVQNTTMIYARGCADGAVFDGYFYIAAGYNTNGRLSNKVQRMHLLTLKWSEVAHMPYANDKLAVSTVSDGLVACGGYAGKYHRDCNKYLPKNDTWIPFPHMIDELEDHLMVNFNGKLMVLGGFAAKRGDTNVVEIFNQTTNSWSNGVSLIEKRQAATVVAF